MDLLLILHLCAEFFATLNSDVIIFQEDPIIEGVQTYSNGTSHPGTAWYAAINIILAHVTRAKPNLAILVGPGNYDKFLYNAMSALPSLLLQPPNELSISTLISIVSYFTPIERPSLKN